jgi:hypothetical protein
MPGPRYEYLLGRSDPPAEVQGKFLVELTGILNGAGYKPQLQTEGGMTFTRRFSPVIFWFFYVLLFPIGLLLLFARPTKTLTVTYVQNSASGTNVTVDDTDKRLREFFERLGATDQLAPAPTDHQPSPSQ